MDSHNGYARNPGNGCGDLVVIDAVKLQWQIRRTSVSKTRFADDMDIGRSTLNRMLAQTPVRRSTVKWLADKLHISVDELLVSTQVASAPAEPLCPWSHAEWEIVPGTKMPLAPLSNGLVMRVVKVRHRVLSTEYGRGKIYDIAGMPEAVRQQCAQALSRHAVVCRQLKACPQVATNLSMASSPDNSIWMSVDEWIESVSLEQLVAQKPLSPKRLRTVMADVADAIRMLHDHRMIARELHPGRILIRDRSHAVITDLELAKLLEVEGSVSRYWQRNNFRAPEVASGESHPQADLYSFARIYLYAITGNMLEDDVDDLELLEQVLPASRLRDQLAACLSPIWNKRPRSISTLRHLLD